MNNAKTVLSPVIAILAYTLTASTVTLFGLGTINQVSFPTVEWWGYLVATMPDDFTQQRVNDWLTYGAIAGAIVAGMTIMRLRSDADVRKGNVPLFGRSKYATVREGKSSGLVYSRKPVSNGLLLGRTKSLFRSRYVSLPNVEHAMLYAKTGAGKGVSYVIPNSFAWQESLVVLDIKLDAWETTAGYRKHTLGQDVYLFAPLAKDGRTHCWNPLSSIDCRNTDYLDRIQKVAFNFFPEMSDKAKFWQDGARSAFVGVAALIAESPDMTLTPGAIFRLFASGDGDAELIRRIEERRAAGNPYSQICVDLISDYLKGTDEVVRGIRKQVSSTMGLWINPLVDAATSRSDFDLADLRRKKITIYLGVMPNTIEQLGVLIRLFMLQLFDCNTDTMPAHDPSLKYRLHVLLDELTSMPAMRTIAKSAGFARGFNVRFSFVVQSKNQIRETYKETGSLASLLECPGAEMIFGTDNPELCKEASERAGDDTVNQISRSTPRFFSFLRVNEQNENTSHTKRPLLLPQEVARLPDDELLMFRQAAQPFRLKRLCWYTDPNFRKLPAPVPPITPLTFELKRDDGSVTFKSESAAAA